MILLLVFLVECCYCVLVLTDNQTLVTTQPRLTHSANEHGRLFTFVRQWPSDELGRVRKLVKFRCVSSCLPAQVTTNSFKKTAITALVKSGGVRIAQQHAGHCCTKNTLRYLRVFFVQQRAACFFAMRPPACFRSLFLPGFCVRTAVPPRFLVRLALRVVEERLSLIHI